MSLGGLPSNLVTDIAAAVGIARRAFFVCSSSEADASWWTDEQDLLSIEKALADSPRGEVQPLQQVIRRSEVLPSWRRRTKEAALARYLMIEKTPELHVGTQRYQRRWSELSARHVRERRGPTSSDPLPAGHRGSAARSRPSGPTGRLR